MSPSTNDEVVLVADVVVVRRTDFGWQCMMEGRPVFVGALQIPRGFQMPVAGECGMLMLTAAAARDLQVSPNAMMRP